MNRLYIKKEKRKDEARKLVKELAWNYSREYLGYSGDLESFVNLYELLVDQNGKPYLYPEGPEFSISHSGDYWACLFSPEKCGVDIQECREVRYNKIAEKVFSLREQQFISENGQDTFYQIWVRREAFGKMTGIGFYCNPPEFLDEDFKFKERIDWDGETYSLIELSVFQGYKCAVCVRDGEVEIHEI